MRKKGRIFQGVELFYRQNAYTVCANAKLGGEHLRKPSLDLVPSAALADDRYGINLGSRDPDELLPSVFLALAVQKRDQNLGVADPVDFFEKVG